MWDVATGLSIGRSFATLKNKEDEVEQGSGAYQASLCQIVQIANFTEIARPLANVIPSPLLRTVAVTCNTMLPFAGVVFCPLAATVKQGHYEPGVKFLQSMTNENRLSTLTARLPDKLSEPVKRMYNCLADNTGNVVRIAMLTGAVTLPLICSPYLAGAMLIPIAYEAIDSRGWVPKRMSLFMEKYMPTTIQFCMLVSGGPFIQLISAVGLASYFPCINQTMHKKLNQFASHYLNLTGPTLEEIDSPLKKYKELSFEEIQKILDSDDWEYEINPAHCSKKVYADLELAEDRDFNKFLQIFNSVTWEKYYPILKRKFQDDDKFLKLIKKKFPSANNDEIYNNFEKYIEELATAEKKSKELWLADLLKKNMEQLVKVLNGEARAKGSQMDTEDAIYNCSKILYYLLTLDSTESIEKEDILLKLAIEGGDYCARGVKRASTEIVSGIVRQGHYKEENFDPMKDYEWKIGQELEQLRLKILETVYQKVIETIVRVPKEGTNIQISLNTETTDPHAVAIAQDVHIMDLYRNYLTLGFYPMNENERNSLGINELFVWSTYAPIRQEMYGIYHARLNECFAEVGEIHFANYLRQTINSNLSLSKEHREILLDQYTECNDGKWSLHETKEKFYRLFFVMQGILQKQKIYKEDWYEVTEEEEETTSGLDEKELLEWNIVDADQKEKLENQNDWVLISEEDEKELI